MPTVDLAVESPLSTSVRAQQLSAMFDVPAQERAQLTWKGELPIETKPWNVGLIVGPSGCGKSTILSRVFGEAPPLAWGKASVIDDFDPSRSMNEIASACQAVGFNTIPAWLRPFQVLSNGERFRVELARRLLEGGDLIALDEFTSVVDRQVAKIGAHAVQRFVRKSARRVVAASCHYDIVDWLQPDWVLEPATMTFQWRSVQRRPAVPVELRRVDFGAWQLFAPFHYLTAELNKAATCWCLFVDDHPAAFAGVIHRPHPARHDIKGISRVVTLPDWQGLGLAMALCDELGGLYKARGWELRMYPAHPSFVRSFDRSPVWRLRKRPGVFSPATGRTGVVKGGGGRPCAVFSFSGASILDPAFAAEVKARS